MKNFNIKYRKILFLIWTFAFLFFATNADFKDFYLFVIAFSLPISIVSEEIMQLLGQSYLIVAVLGYIGGFIQWVVVVGGIMDKFLPKIAFGLKMETMKAINNTIFVAGVFGFVLSAITIQNAFVNAVFYSVSLALVVCSIGIKVLFLDKDNI